MTKIEVQYFHGCPNSEEMIKRVKEAVSKTEVSVDYKEILINTPEKAEQYKFRGSPTVLVNGNDLEGLSEPKNGNLACRYYKDGIPSTEKIISIIQHMEKNQ